MEGIAVDRAALQRRTLKVLMASQVLAGAGIAAAFSVGGLLAEDITGSDTLAGAVTAFLPIGSAAATLPLARHMARTGRRPGLRGGYAIAVAGALAAVAAAQLRFVPLLAIALAAMGVSSATNLAARYAAADLAPEEGRAKAIGLLIWATTIGTAAGPTLVGVADDVGGLIGLREFAGPFLFSIAFFAFASLNIEKRLHPDPLVVAGGVGQPVEGRPPVRTALKVIASNRLAQLAVGAMVTGHLVMVAVMTMTPLHMKDADHEVQIIGFVISVHVIGMYAFSPVVGWITDRVGRLPVIAIGGVTLIAATEVAGHSDSTNTAQLFTGLFLLGLGWSFGLIGGSSLLVDVTPIDQRVAVQGLADLAMTGAGALGGLSSGVIVAMFGYHDLNMAGAVVAGLLVAAVVATRLTNRHVPRVL